MEVFEDSENREFDIKLVDFPFLCRICLRRGDWRSLEEDDYLLNLFVTITKIDVHSPVNFPRKICNECIKKLEEISSFIDISKRNDARQGKNLITEKENESMAIDTCGMSQDHVIKTEQTTEECEEDIYSRQLGSCRICFLTSCLTLFQEKAHLMQLFQNITNIDVEAEMNFSKRKSMCNKCIIELEKITLFISLSIYNDTKFKNTIAWNMDVQNQDDLEENEVDNEKEIEFESVSGKNEVKVENCFNENACFFENKYLHEVVDIKEEYLTIPEATAKTIKVIWNSVLKPNLKKTHQIMIRAIMNSVLKTACK